MDEQEAMGRYSSQYEASLDPFAAFGAKASLLMPFNYCALIWCSRTCASVTMRDYNQQEIPNTWEEKWLPLGKFILYIYG